MKPKYVICPGEVTSQTDGQRHYVGPMQLMRLYGVEPRECEIHEPAPWWPESYYRMAEERQLGLPRLGPRYDGNYELHNRSSFRSEWSAKRGMKVAVQLFVGQKWSDE